MEWSKKNFTSREGRMMTLTGFALIVLGVITLIFTDNETVSVLLILGGFGAMGLKDPRGGSPGQAATMIAWLLILLTGSIMLSSCVTYKKCVDKFGERQAQPITLRDTVKVPVEIPVPGDSITGSIPCDSIKQDTTTQTSDTGKAQIKYWYNKYLKAMEYQVNCLPQIVRDTVEVPVEIKGECPDVVVVDPKNASWPARFLAWYQLFAGWALLIGLIVFAVWMKMKPKTIMYVEKDSAKGN